MQPIREQKRIYRPTKHISIAPYVASESEAHDDGADIRISRQISVSRISAEKIRPAECLFPTTGLIANSKRSSLSADRLHKICFVHDNCKLAFE